MINITNLILFLSIFTSFPHVRGNDCGTKIITLDPNLGLGEINCTDMGEYSRNGCHFLEKDGNIVCKLTPLENQKAGSCYHAECQWEDIDSYKLNWEVNPPYDTITVEMAPKADLHPVVMSILTLLVLSFWIYMCISNPDLAFIICLSSCRDGSSSSSRSSKIC